MRQPTYADEPAFPVGGQCTGLTVRAFIATQIASGLVSNSLKPGVPDHEIAMTCVNMADALLAALNEHQE